MWGALYFVWVRSGAWDALGCWFWICISSLWTQRRGAAYRGINAALRRLYFVYIFLEGAKLGFDPTLHHYKVFCP